MMPFGYPFYVWLRANPLAQWLLGIAAAYATFRLWLWRKIVSVRREVQEDAREAVIEQIEEQTDEAIQRVEDERVATRALNEQQLLDLAAKSPNNRGRLHSPEAD